MRGTQRHQGISAAGQQQRASMMRGSVRASQAPVLLSARTAGRTMQGRGAAEDEASRRDSDDSQSAAGAPELPSRSSSRSVAGSSERSTQRGRHNTKGTYDDTAPAAPAAASRPGYGGRTIPARAQLDATDSQEDPDSDHQSKASPAPRSRQHGRQEGTDTQPGHHGSLGVKHDHEARQATTLAESASGRRRLLSQVDAADAAGTALRGRVGARVPPAPYDPYARRTSSTALPLPEVLSDTLSDSTDSDAGERASSTGGADAASTVTDDRASTSMGSARQRVPASSARYNARGNMTQRLGTRRVSSDYSSDEAETVRRAAKVVTSRELHGAGNRVQANPAAASGRYSGGWTDRASGPQRLRRPPGSPPSPPEWQ